MRFTDEQKQTIQRALDNPYDEYWKGKPIWVNTRALLSAASDSLLMQKICIFYFTDPKTGEYSCSLSPDIFSSDLIVTVGKTHEEAFYQAVLKLEQLEREQNETQTA